MSLLTEYETEAAGLFEGADGGFKWAGVLIWSDLKKHYGDPTLSAPENASKVLDNVRPTDVAALAQMALECADQVIKSQIWGGDTPPDWQEKVTCAILGHELGHGTLGRIPALGTDTVQLLVAIARTAIIAGVVP